VTIRDIDPVDTSFPGFADCLRAVGADITVVDRSPA
jgi:5-enolpyruvylshikimate-3-phosphate synthase